MERGLDFVKSQVNNAVASHRAFVEALDDHGSQAEDPRYRELCVRHLAPMREHQRMLEDYQRALGGEEGVMKKVTAGAAGFVRDLADRARESDFLRLVNDIIMARQGEDTFKTFREGGKMLGDRQLEQIGEIGERHHDSYVHEANRLVQTMFVEHVRDVPSEVQSATRTSDIRL